MQISLNGYGIFDLEEQNYKRFTEIVSIDIDMLLNLIDMRRDFGVIPIISVNAEIIDKEGPIPYSHHRTEIGVKRMKQLVEEKIITQINTD